MHAHKQGQHGRCIHNQLGCVCLCCGKRILWACRAYAFLAAPTLAPQNVFGGSLHGVNTVTSEPISCISLMRLENLQHSHTRPACVTRNQLLSGACTWAEAALLCDALGMALSLPCLGTRQPWGACPCRQEVSRQQNAYQVCRQGLGGLPDLHAGHMREGAAGGEEVFSFGGNVLVVYQLVFSAGRTGRSAASPGLHKQCHARVYLQAGTVCSG